MNKSKIKELKWSLKKLRGLIFHFILFCVNYDVCECVHVEYKHDITLYNLTFRKYKDIVMIQNMKIYKKEL